MTLPTREDLERLSREDRRLLIGLLLDVERDRAQARRDRLNEKLERLHAELTKPQ